MERKRYKENWSSGGSALKGITIGRQAMLIAVILISAGMLEIFFGFLILYRYSNESQTLENNVIETFMSEYSQRFDYVSASVYRLAYNDNTVIKAAGDAYNRLDGSASAIIEYHNSISDIQDLFNSMEDTYGSEYGFFCLDQDTGSEVIISNDYNSREKFRKELRQAISDGSINDYMHARWTVMNHQYIVMVAEGANGYVGSFVNVDVFMKSMLSAITGDDVVMMLTDNDHSFVYIMKRKTGAVSSKMSGNVKAENDWHSMYNASFAVRLQVNQKVYSGIFLLQILFILSVVLFAILSLRAISYIRKDILRQADIFYDALKNKTSGMRFDEETGLFEFDEAGRKFNALADEINNLKIEAYENRNEKQKLELDKQNLMINNQSLELDYLQLQIRPHFYINCLNVIYSMAQLGKTSEIQDLIEPVTRYLRYIFKRSMKPVKLFEEVNFVRDYLSTISNMYLTRLEFKCEVEAEVDDFLLPPLLIQTFVENSVIHGMTNEELFVVQLNAYVEEDFVIIKIEDSGKGLDNKTIKCWNSGSFENDDDSAHVGIRNAIRRTAILYKGKSKLSFGKSEMGGAMIIMKLPRLVVGKGAGLSVN